MMVYSSDGHGGHKGWGGFAVPSSLGQALPLLYLDPLGVVVVVLPRVLVLGSLKGTSSWSLSARTLGPLLISYGTGPCAQVTHSASAGGMKNCTVTSNGLSM